MNDYGDKLKFRIRMIVTKFIMIILVYLLWSTLVEHLNGPQIWNNFCSYFDFAGNPNGAPAAWMAFFLMYSIATVIMFAWNYRDKADFVGTDSGIKKGVGFFGMLVGIIVVVGLFCLIIWWIYTSFIAPVFDKDNNFWGSQVGQIISFIFFISLLLSSFLFDFISLGYLIFKYFNEKKYQSRLNDSGEKLMGVGVVSVGSLTEEDFFQLKKFTIKLKELQDNKIDDINNDEFVNDCICAAEHISEKYNIRNEEDFDTSIKNADTFEEKSHLHLAKCVLSKINDYENINKSTISKNEEIDEVTE